MDEGYAPIASTESRDIAMAEIHRLTLQDSDGLAPESRSDIQVLEFLTERITVRELIRSRVYQEVKDYNARQPEYFRGLVRPAEAERTLNGYRLRQRRLLDWQEQFEAALKAFAGNGFLILVEEEQATDLEQEIVITPGAAVTFIKLTPLVGG